MGVLSGVGSTAQGLANSSNGFTTLATGANAFGSLMEGIGGYQQARYAANVANMNANIALMAGQQAESASKMRYGALAAEQTAGFAANGISVNSATPGKVAQGTADMSALDAALLHYNAAKEAFGEKTQATLFKAAGDQSLAKGLLGVGNSILGGSQSLTDKWLSYKLNLPGPKVDGGSGSQPWGSNSAGSWNTI